MLKQDIQLIRTEQKYVFLLVVLLRYFKRHMHGVELLLQYTLHSRTNLENLDIDSVSYAITLCFCLHCFRKDYNTIEDFFDDNNHIT